jgi:hypothetical protein
MAPRENFLPCGICPMTELTRRQVGLGALAVLAASAFPAPVARIVAFLDAGDQFERQQAEWMREIADLYAEFRRVDSDYFIDQDARDSWLLAHHDLAGQSQILRVDPLGDRDTKWAIRAWLDTLYPSPAVRAYHVPKPLNDLSKDFADRQAELDAVTYELGEAEYRGALYRRQVSWTKTCDLRYWALTELPVDRILRKQDKVAASFSHLTAETHDDKTALLRATMTYNSDYWVRKLNARRRWRLTQHA